MKTTAIPIEKINREELRSRIPHKGIKQIIEKTKTEERPNGYSRQWVSKVLEGKEDNPDILQIAYDLFWTNVPAIQVREEHAEELVAA